MLAMHAVGLNRNFTQFCHLAHPQMNELIRAQPRPEKERRCAAVSRALPARNVSQDTDDLG
ncbi:hypothetical protein WJ84_02260 [Burkholderia ubonensis]|nr:hypothetical protein WJ84_02260 [Burkholderia ubonensis]